MQLVSELYSQVAVCQACLLSRTRTKVVPGEGPQNAKIFFIGEAPGWHEDQQGRPFVGPAGHFLEELLGLVNLKRNDVYIANVIKCRPPANRDPLPIEIESCKKWLDLQIEMIKPLVIVTLGRYSMARAFPGQVISKVHGTTKKLDGITYFAMYHPAAALHQGSLRQVIMDDMLKLPQYLTQPVIKTEEAKQPEQLSLL